MKVINHYTLPPNNYDYQNPTAYQWYYEHAAHKSEIHYGEAITNVWLSFYIVSYFFYIYVTRLACLSSYSITWKLSETTASHSLA